jgi:hypothetical protein
MSEDYEKAYFERGMFAAYAWMITKKRGDELSDAVVDRAWDNRDAGMGPAECLPKRPTPTLAVVKHPLDGVVLREVLDYAARLLADEANDMREYRIAIDRFDEAYMWLVAAQQKCAA